MNYGFLVDNRKCIGCHACSTACKSENQVPLGVNRTWVKTVEQGRFPEVRRSFQVSRCNHCANPPCVRICPVTAMYQRKDGIVEFDSDVCIGCKACLQACPYDAIYVDPDSGTAAKCHFCGHRLEQNLEPACVVVCPEHAILAGDLDNPESEIAKTIARNAVSVRKPEQGTAPKLFYIDGNAVSLVPTATPRTPNSMAAAEVLPLHGEKPSAYQASTYYEVHLDIGDGGASLRPASEQGSPSGGPITIGEGRMAAALTQVTYNAQHKIPWHWPVPAYLVTKSLGTGIFLILGLGSWMSPQTGALVPLMGALGIFFTLVTTGLLVGDLERPERFLRILTRPQWKSWLTRGAFLLVGFSLISGLWWLYEMMPHARLMHEGTSLSPSWTLAFALPVLPLAVGAAIYTAFLFGQAEGRDFWQSPLLPLQLLVQSLTLGAGAFVVVYSVANAPLPGVVPLCSAIFGVGLLAHLATLVLGEFAMPHASETAAQAAKAIRSGHWRWHYRGALWLGHVIPMGLLLLSAVNNHSALSAADYLFPMASGPAAVMAVLLSLVGFYLYEHAFVMAPQEVQNS